MPKTAPKEESTELVSIQERIKQRLANVNKTTAVPGSKKISLKHSKFRIPDGATSEGPLNCVIVDYTNSNVWYEKEWKDGEVSPPDCFSIGKIIDELKPSASVEKPVNKDCISCPKNEYGSRGRGKECDNTVLLAILAEGFTDESEVYTIQIKPKGLKDWGAYVRTLKQSGMDPVQVVTSISFDPTVSYPKLKYRALGENLHLDLVSQFMPAADSLLQNS